MKKYLFILTALLFSVFTSISFAGNDTTETFKVWGNCGMCKKTIEKASKIDGVHKAVWDVKTNQMTVTFNPKKTNLLAVQKSICAAGYDNDGCTGDNTAYDNLHTCCKYERK